jgi:hypothetical protein
MFGLHIVPSFIVYPKFLRNGLLPIFYASDLCSLKACPLKSPSNQVHLSCSFKSSFIYQILSSLSYKELNSPNAHILLHSSLVQRPSEHSLLHVSRISRKWGAGNAIVEVK